MRRALIACGGTGGHLSPGIALAEKLVSRGWTCELIISNKQVDSRLVNKYSSFDYFSVPGSPLSLNPVRFGKFLYSLCAGVSKCLMHIRKSNPDLVIGFGGFLSASSLLAGRALGIPVAIHEANRIPGRVTRLVSLFASRIYLPTGVLLRTAHYSRIRNVGMPVRNEIVSMSKTRAKRMLGLDPSQRLVVVMGGSQGAKSLTDWVKTNIERLALEGVQLYCLTGMQGGSDSTVTFKSRDGTEVKSVFVRFSDEMVVILSAADLMISRAGAGSIAEMIRCRVPSILIPYPHAADNHQEHNAQYLQRRGGAILVGQAYMGDLLSEVRDTLFSDWLLQQLRGNLEKIDSMDVRDYMAKDLEGLVDSFRSKGNMRTQTQAVEGVS